MQSTDKHSRQLSEVMQEIVTPRQHKNKLFLSQQAAYLSSPPFQTLQANEDS